MTHAALVNTVLTAYGTVLFAGLVAYYRYGDRSEVVSRLLAGNQDTLDNLRRTISTGLALALEPVFATPGTTVSVVLNPQGQPYEEVEITPAGTESYRDAVFHFVGGNTTAVADLVILTRSLRKWRAWARYQSWSIVVCLWAAAIFGLGLFGVERLFGYQLPDPLIIASGVPLILTVFNCFLIMPFLLYHHDQIMKIRETYEPFV